jgi:hypothetical protein
VFVSTNTVATNSTQPNFGANVLIFDPTMSMSVIQIQLSALFSLQQNNQFGTNRYACFFKPGQYTGLDVDLGYCTQLIGVGQMPDDVGDHRQRPFRRRARQQQRHRQFLARL